MALDLSAGSLMRAGSGALFLLFGLFVLAVGRGTRRSVLLGIFSVSVGASLILGNLVRPDETLGPPGLWFAAALVVVGFLALGRFFVEGVASRPLIVVGVVLSAFAATALYAYGSIPAEAIAARGGTALVAARADYVFVGAYFSGLAVLFAGSATMATRFRSEEDSRDRAALAWVAIAASAWAGTDLGGILVPAAHGQLPMLLPIAFLPLAALACGAWLSATRGHDTRLARWVAWTIPSFAIVGMLATRADITAGTDAFRVAIGVVRVCAVAALALAVMQYRLLGFDLAVPTARRGALATVALVGFFVVAQIAQEFLSDSMGVVLGGVAAGALLFAAVPLQRAAERMTIREAPVRSSPAGAEASGLLEGYRAAVRVALHDGRLTDEEEAHLAEAAERLGIGAATALRIRREVEAEYGHR